MPYNVGWHDCRTFCFATDGCKILERVSKGRLLHVFVMQGAWGGPMLISSDPIDDNMDGTKRARPDQDILVGVISNVNTSNPFESGIGCINIGSIYGWIQEIAFVEVTFNLNHFHQGFVH